jgi:acyl carrier protein
MDQDLRGDLQSRIIAIAAHCFKVKPEDISLNTTQNETVGWDSLAHLEFIAALEENLRISFSPTEIMQIERLSDAWKIIAEKLR